MSLNVIPVSDPPAGGISWFQLVDPASGNCWTLINRTDTTFVIGLQPRALATDMDALQRQLFFAVTPPPDVPAPPVVLLVSFVTFNAEGRVWDFQSTSLVGIEATTSRFLTPHINIDFQSWALPRFNPGVSNAMYLNFATPDGKPTPQGQGIEADNQGLFGSVLRGSPPGNNPRIAWQVHPLSEDIFPAFNALQLSTKALYNGGSVLIAAQSSFPGRTLQINPSGPGPQDCLQQYTAVSATDYNIDGGGTVTTDVYRLEFIDDETFCVRFTPPTASCFWYLRASPSTPGQIQATALGVNTRFSDKTFQWQSKPLFSSSLNVFDWDAFDRSDQQGVVLPVTPPTRMLYNVGANMFWSWNGGGQLVSPSTANLQQNSPSSSGNEGVYAYIYPIDVSRTQAGVLTDVIMHPITLMRCCTDSSLNDAEIAMCSLTDLVPQTATCDTYMTQVCQAQMPDNSVTACACFNPPPAGVPGLSSRNDVCFDQACWSTLTDAYRTAAVQQVSNCPKSVCLHALKTLHRAVFFTGAETVDCSGVPDILSSLAPPVFTAPPENGGSTPSISGQATAYDPFLDYAIAAGIVVILVVILCTGFMMMRWRRYRSRALRGTGAADTQGTSSAAAVMQAPWPSGPPPVMVPVSIAAEPAPSWS
jgi:hypothetical protein